MMLLRQAWRQLLREWRSPALFTLFIAITVATGALTAVSTLTDRVARGLERNAGELLAADLVVASRQQLEKRWLELAGDRGLESASFVAFPTVIFNEQQRQLVELKAVTEGYPLRGTLRVSPALDDTATRNVSAPPAGQAWAEPRLLAALDLEVGESVTIGNTELTIAGVIRYEPDRGGDLYALAPRLMINRADLDAAGLLGTGSRAWYRQLFAGEAAVIDAFRADIAPQLPPGQRLETLSDDQQQVGDALGQADRFLTTAALITILIAVAGILLAASRFADHHRDTTALLRCFGAPHRISVGMIMLEILLVALIAALFGALLGWAAQAALAQTFAGAVAGGLPSTGLRPLGFSLLLGTGLAVGFALPPLLPLRNVPPARVLNQSLDENRKAWWLWLIPIVAVFGISYWQLGDGRLTLIVVGGTLVAALVMIVAARLLIALLRRTLGRIGGQWRFGLAGLARRAKSGSLQIAALGIGLTALLLLLVVRNDLLEGWKMSLPEDTPNRFLVNIQPDQKAEVLDVLSAGGAESVQIKPMAVTRLIEINGRAPNADDYDKPWEQRRVSGTLNISWAEDLPPANEVTAGDWWTDTNDIAEGETEFSLDADWARGLDLQLGDRLTFEAGAQHIEGPVTSLRTVDWDSFNVNFFILASPGAADRLPHQLVGSFYDPDSGADILRSLAQRFPNITLVDVEAILQRVKAIIDRVSEAAQIVFLFTFAAGIAVLAAAITVTRDERRQEAALIRVLGARNREILTALTLEYGLSALLAASLAALAAGITGYVLATEAFQMSNYQADYLGLLIGGTVGGSLMLIAGLVGNLSVLNAAPVRILRT